jgi:hypothetical protein
VLRLVGALDFLRTRSFRATSIPSDPSRPDARDFLGVISNSAFRLYPRVGANDTAPAHATGVIRPSETAFVLALAISLAAYPTGKIQSSDKSEHSIEASPGSGPVFGRHVEHRLDLDGAEGPNSWDRPL